MSCQIVSLTMISQKQSIAYVHRAIYILSSSHKKTNYITFRIMFFFMKCRLMRSQQPLSEDIFCIVHNICTQDYTLSIDHTLRSKKINLIENIIQLCHICMGRKKYILRRSQQPRVDAFCCRRRLSAMKISMYRTSRCVYPGRSEGDMSWSYQPRWHSTNQLSC